ncbi:MAG TPA: hypothetical protein VJ777_14290 [Mycobacterium sp.]|nr:hypothetical protein [Mycobacterium sp.]
MPTAIRGRGLAAIKALRFQADLCRIELETGELCLNWVAAKSMESARAWLVALPGVGPKTTAYVLLFSLGQPTMPVDTHVRRVNRRLGLIDRRASAVNTDQVLEHLTGPDRGAVYELHLNLIAHGRVVCHARRPAYHRCVLVALCPSAPQSPPATRSVATGGRPANPD